MPLWVWAVMLRYRAGNSSGVRGGGRESVIALSQETQGSAWHRQGTGSSNWPVCFHELFCF